MRVFLFILGVVFVITAVGGVSAMLRVLAAKAKRKQEDEQREAEEIVRRFDERVAQREREALGGTSAASGDHAPAPRDPLPSSRPLEPPQRQE